MRESKGSLANILMLGLLGLLFVMAGFGWVHGARVRDREEPSTAKVPSLSEMQSEISTQFQNLTVKIPTAESELSTAMGQDVEFAPNNTLRTLGAIQEKVKALVTADDDVNSSLQGLEDKLKTLQALGGAPLLVERALPFLARRKAEAAQGLKLPTPEQLDALSTELKRLHAAYHESGHQVEAHVHAALEHSDRVLEKLDGLGVARDIALRRVYKKAHGLWDGQFKGIKFDIEKQLGEVRDRHPGWFNWARLNMLVIFLLLSGAILYYIERGRAGETLKIRRIAGLNALDEAVGRATEMGKPVLFVTGIMDLDDIQTLAGLNILGHVARKTAEYESDLQVPCLWPMTMSAAQEIVRESYLRAGKPDNYRADRIYYLSSDPFAFAAGASAIMQREKPATVFYMGSFYAESLLMAEIGNVIGAIQIAGTAQQTQLPFFVAACDYTLIGEEMFAASAYLSNEPMLLGSLKGQDAGKVVMMVSIVLGTLLELAICAGLVPVSWSLIRFFITA